MNFIDPTLISFRYECVKCRGVFHAFTLDFESFVSESIKHLKNDATRVEPVCRDCFQNHFAKYEQTTDT